MTVEIVWGAAEGRTELGAFDAALAAAGLENYNLVRFSSIVPPDRRVEEVGTHERRYPVGEPVGVVLADARSSEPGEPLTAGLGWQRATEGGVFYEESGPSCRERLEAGLADARELRDWDWEPDPSIRLHEHTVERVGAVVVGAVYGPLAGDGR